MVLLDNLSSRIAAILLAGLTVLLVFGAALLIWPSDNGGGVRFYQLPQPTEVMAMVEALQASPPSARPAVITALDTGVIRANLATDFPAALRRARKADTRDPGYAAYDRALAGRDWRIEVRRGGRLREGFMPGRAALRLSVKLKDGSVLTLRRRAPEAARRYLGRITLACAALLAVTLLMILVAVRQTTLPVESLAKAVARFGDDLDAAPLSAHGPREIRELSASFNTMREQIRGLVNERTRMLAAIAHDLRTYLTRLTLRAEFIADPEQRTKAARDLAEMSQLLDDTLLFARQEARRGESARPVAVRRELEALVALRAEMGQILALEDGDAVEALVSPVALRRMLANLIDNAIAYGDAVSLSVSRTKDEVRITVLDRGPGLPDDVLVRIAAPFERGEASRNRRTGGAGLGLSSRDAGRIIDQADGNQARRAQRPAGLGLVCGRSLPARPVTAQGPRADKMGDRRCGPGFWGRRRLLDRRPDAAGAISPTLGLFTDLALGRLASSAPPTVDPGGRGRGDPRADCPGRRQGQSDATTERLAHAPADADPVGRRPTDPDPKARRPDDHLGVRG